MHLIFASPDSLLRQRYARWLLEEGHTPLVCSHGIQALSAWERHAVPLVVCELSMPLYSGVDVGRRIRAFDRPRYTCVVLLHKADEPQAVLDEAVSAGIDVLLPRDGAPDALRPFIGLAGRLANLQAQVHQLEALVTMCVYCRSVEEQDGAWTQVDRYMQHHLHTVVSHGVCPDCLNEQRRKLAQERGKPFEEITHHG